MGRDRAAGTVVVSGGASGLGAAVVAALRTAGATPVVVDRRPPAQPPAPGETPFEVPYEIVDVASWAQTRDALSRLRDRVGPFDGAVTCAGIDHPAPFEALDPASWDQIVAVNLLGTANVARAVLADLAARQGRLVTVASTLGHRVVPDATAYCASKWGVVGFTRALAAELKGRVGVTLITPGGMGTAFFDDRSPQYKPAPETPLADPAEVAEAVVFALTRPAGVSVWELVVSGAQETSWP